MIENTSDTETPNMRDTNTPIAIRVIPINLILPVPRTALSPVTMED